METKISVLLADPGEQYRAAYSKAIGQETDMELVAQTDNGLRAEELITKFQPDVVVLDSFTKLYRNVRNCNHLIIYYFTSYYLLFERAKVDI